MDTNRDNTMQLLESKIESIVREVLSEKKNFFKHKKIKPKQTADDKIKSNDAYKRQYKAIEAYLDRPEVDATQVLAKALGFDANDDSARSHAFKKLHKEETPDGTKKYKFSPEEVGKIFSEIS